MTTTTTKSDLIAFESEVARLFEDKKIRGPVHLSGGNEEALISIFENVKPEDWVFSTYRSHYHALLHGIRPAEIMDKIISGRSMNLSFPEHRFFTSAIVGGCLPIATGVALAIKLRGTPGKVWCFVGDMAATTGAFHEAANYAERQDLPIQFVIEDNGLSCDSPTWDCWGRKRGATKKILYQYERQWPHVGVGKHIAF